MNIYSVFLPGCLAPAKALECAQLVKQGLHWDAFLITPIWAVRRKLWLAFGLWIVAAAAIALIAVAAHLGIGAGSLLYLICVLAFGLEADRLRQASLVKAGFLMQGLAFGGSIQDAEVAFFATRKHDMPDEPSNGIEKVSARSSPGRSPVGRLDLLGLFPPRESET